MQLVEKEFRILNRFVSFFIYTFIVIITVFCVVLFTIEKTDTLVVPGTVEPDSLLIIRSPVQGIITALYVKHGDSVLAGDTICTVETPDPYGEHSKTAHESNAAVTTPKGGTVHFTSNEYTVNRKLEKGENVCMLYPGAGWVLRCAVSERIINRVEVEQNVSIAFNALPITIHRLYEGTVRSVYSLPVTPEAGGGIRADGTFYPVEIKLDDASLDSTFHTTVRYGMSATARISVEKRPLYTFLWENLIKRNRRSK